MEITSSAYLNNMEVRMNGNLIGTIPNRRKLNEGQIFKLSDDTALRIQYVKNEVRVLWNDEPVPGSPSDPAARLAQSSGSIYFIAALNIVLGFIVLLFHVEFLQALGFGMISIAIGFMLLTLGFFTQRRSLIALIISLTAFSLESVLIVRLASNKFFNVFITKLSASDIWVSLNLFGKMLMREALLIGCLVG